MDLDFSPPSLTRSPVSPPNSDYTGSPSLGYPSPDLVDPLQKIVSMYAQSCAASAVPITVTMDSGHSLPPLESMTSAEWAGAPLAHASSSAGAPTNMLSAEYDPFAAANYEPTMHVPYSHDLYHSHRAHAAALPNHSSQLASHSSRSPDMSSRHSVAYHSASPMPHMKMESAVDYSSGAEMSQFPSPRSAPGMPVDAAGYGSNAGSSGYLSDAPSGTWNKSEFPHLEPDQLYGGAGSSGASLVPDRRQTLRVSRSQRRQPRKLTTKEEANFQCEVKGCGKLFSRSYNYKAHLETHDENREYPFPCNMPNCNKKFVRKTDLQRHNQSVHMKERSHKCDYCGRMFARKDTLRRHMEDGCSKRFDLGTLDLREVDEYDGGYNAAPRTLGSSSSGPLAAPVPHLPPMALPHGGGSSHLVAPMPPSYTKR
ncbi:hypothetical protein GGR56DRAFT_4567 [Xylariaceae sp. FL0804]|nr:hypothetical protein GGR56DRAFT_4567 [Xylariaceae sp. FL0804]